MHLLMRTLRALSPPSRACLCVRPWVPLRGLSVDRAPLRPTAAAVGPAGPGRAMGSADMPREGPSRDLAKLPGQLPTRTYERSWEHVVGREHDGRRVWEVLREALPEEFNTVSAAKRATRRGEFRILAAGEGGQSEGPCGRAGQGVAVATEVRDGDMIVRYVSRTTAADLIAAGRTHVTAAQRAVPVPVVYEDPHMAVVCKMQNLVTIGRGMASLHGCLPLAMRVAPGDRPLWRPQPCHRLDRATGGLVVVAKTEAAMRSLSIAFAKGHVRKTYNAVVRGSMQGKGTVDGALNGRRAVTEWRCVRRARSATHGTVTLVELRPLTGRTHQLRRHMAIRGHAILGDARYAEKWGRGEGRREIYREHVGEREGDSNEHFDAADGERDSNEGSNEDCGIVAYGADDDGGPDDDDDGDVDGDGDGDVDEAGVPAIALWAVRLEVPHPVWGETVAVELPFPRQLEACMEAGDMVRLASVETPPEALSQWPGHAWDKHRQRMERGEGMMKGRGERGEMGGRGERGGGVKEGRDRGEGRDVRERRGMREMREKGEMREMRRGDMRGSLKGEESAG